MPGRVFQHQNINPSSPPLNYPRYRNNTRSMGGASSRFDETQWWNADGELGNSQGDQPETIIPGERPTSGLEIFDILKSKSITSQRDFKVRDGKKNVVYVTRAVPGTLAWFDILRPGDSEVAEVSEREGEGKEANEEAGEEATEDTAEKPPLPEKKEELLLRVQVDWNRRSWIVYSCTPVFPGQLPATLSDRKGLEEGQDLYKSCCITLSWSKALALVARYGPPTKLQDFWEDGDDDDDDDDAGAPTHNKSHSRRDSDFFTSVFFKKADSIAARARKGHVGVDTGKVPSAIKENEEPRESHTEKDEGEEGILGQLANSVKTLIDTREPSSAYQSKKEKQKLSLEGVLDLDAPLLQCQTVLGTKANYQSRLVDKEETLKLWMLDDAWNNERFLRHGKIDEVQDPFKNPLAKAVAYEKEHFEGDLAIETLKKWFSTVHLDDDHLVSKEEENVPAQNEKDSGSRRSLMAGGKSWFSFRMSAGQSIDVAEAGSESQGEGDTESGSGSGDEATASDSASKDGSGDADEIKTSEVKVYGSSNGIIEDDTSEDRKEPLVAYWQWKNSYTRHKIQMHLAKNSDLALHVVLSIILNICRYEWH
eukprot:scaffold818_cov136-Cylindrotheca_fusiformis.AAC.44